MSELSIDVARPGDAGAVAALSAELGYPVGEAEVVERLAEMGEGEHRVYVARTDGRVVGWLHVAGVRRLEAPAYAELGGLVVARAARRRGIARRLVESARAWAAARGYSRLRVRSNVLRDEAHRFYPSLDFERTKDQAVYERPTGEPS